MLQFHLDGWSTCTASRVHSPCTPCKQGSSQVERTPKDGRRSSFTALNPTDETTKKTCGQFLGTQSVGSIWEKPRIKDYSSGRPDPTPRSFVTQYLLTALKKWEVPEEDKNVYQRIALTSAWQVQHDKEVQLPSSTEESCAEQEKSILNQFPNARSTAECST